MSPSPSAFAYATVRVVPDIEREEFVNAGLIVFARERRFLVARTHLEADALRVLDPGCDIDGVRRQLELVERMAAGEVRTPPFDAMSQSERFHWLTTPRSTIVQPGPVHSGTTEDPVATLDHLFSTLVLRAAAD